MTLKFSNSTAAAGNEAPRSAGCVNIQHRLCNVSELTCAPAAVVAAGAAESDRHKSTQIRGEEGAAAATAAVAAAVAAAAAALTGGAAAVARALAHAALLAGLAERAHRAGTLPLLFRCLLPSRSRR